MALSACDTKIDGQGRELLDHGTALFPAACYHDDLSTEKVPWHWHDELEAVVVTEGGAVVAAGTEKYTVTSGNGFFINAGVLHAAWEAGGSGCRFHSVVFHPRLVGGGIDSIFWQKYLQPLMENPSLRIADFDRGVPWESEAVEAIETAWQCCANETPGYEFVMRSALSHLVFLLYSRSPSSERLPSRKALRDGERMKIMLQYVQDHYSEELSTEQIAASAVLSESECLRCFRSVIGTTPIRYVRQFRIQEAARLLNTTDHKIADIAAQCGFQEMSYFSKTFRQLKGCTPSEYREK